MKDEDPLVVDNVVATWRHQWDGCNAVAVPGRSPKCVTVEREKLTPLQRIAAAASPGKQRARGACADLIHVNAMIAA